MTVYLAGIGTTVPGILLPQETVLDWTQRKMGEQLRSVRHVEQVFQNAGIDRRYSVAELDWFEETKTGRQRNSVYLDGATDLFIEAARRALDSSGWSARDVDAIVSVTSTGIATPTLEARAHRELGFRDSVMRVPVFGLGCAGGVSGLAIARDLAANSQRRVLMVTVETCTVQFRSIEVRKADIIAAALFGDGAAAACLSGHPGDADAGLCSLGSGIQQIWPETLSIMGWDIRNDGFHVIFDRSIPPFVLEHLSDAVDTALDRFGRTLDDYHRLVCHPGGTKVLAAIEDCLDLPAATLDVERQVLRDFGNMSAPTVLFVLQRVLESGRRGDMLMSALGPGFTVSFLPIEIS